jgi:hypothetical protein
VQVHRPTRSHQETATTLQNSLPAALTSALPGPLAHMSSGWVRGCVQMFVWVAHLKRRVASGSSDGVGGVEGSTAAQPPGDQSLEGINTGSATPAATGPAMLQHQLAAAALAAGAQGAVDVQASPRLGPTRYQLGPETVADAALVGTRAGSSSGAADLCIQRISPACLTLSDPAAAPAGSTDSNPVEVHLSSHQFSHVSSTVRLLLFTAVTGAVVVDQEEVTRRPQWCCMSRLLPLSLHLSTQLWQQVNKTPAVSQGLLPPSLSPCTW